VLVVSLANLANWQVRIIALGNAPGAIMMMPWESVLFVCASISLLLVARPNGPRWARVAALVLAISVLCFALAHAFEWVSGQNLGIDRLLFPDTVSEVMGRPAGRISENGTAALLFVAAALIAIHIDDRDGRSSAQWFAYVSLSIAFVAFVGYIFGVVRFYALTTLRGMSVTSTLCMIVLSAGIIFARRTHGLPRFLMDPGPAGSVSRRLVPAAILVPFLLGLLRTYGERAHLFGKTVGSALFVVANTALFLWLVRWSARMAHQSDQERETLLVREQVAREAAETANVAKSNFLMVMSHELRTPLSAILGYEELLVDGLAGPVTDAQRHQLGRIKVSAQHLLRLIDQILDYSRVDAARDVTHIQTVSANTLAEDAITLIKPLAQEKNLRVLVVHASPDITMRIDGAKVRQLLVTILSNAVNFTSTGTVTLTIRRFDLLTVTFVVQDTGIGIAPEHLEHIFDPFWQAEQPNTRRIGGTGLGLSVARRIAHLLGGEVTVESVVGTGSSFTVRLPINPPS
jgi:signal transduction histidine kinase